jgi:shikimate 5-dehydrogenase
VRGQIWFVGVRTAGSAALAAFPAWMHALRVEADVVGIDLALDAPDSEYRALVKRFRDREEAVGAVVTGHKARLYEAAADELDAISDTALGCREVSVLHRRRGQVLGTAIEVASTRYALQAIVEPSHWASTGGHLLILGAGGTAAALIDALYDHAADAERGPGAVHVIDLAPQRARRLSARIGSLATDVVVSSPGPQDAPSVLSQLPPNSLIVNATGVGKDSPGSPLPLPAPWPTGGIFWEINYRGVLALLKDAIARAGECGLRVHDGWGLFVAGWSEALAVILDRPLDCHTRTAVEDAALAARGRR